MNLDRQKNAVKKIREQEKAVMFLLKECLFRNSFPYLAGALRFKSKERQS